MEIHGFWGSNPIILVSKAHGEAQCEAGLGLDLACQGTVQLSEQVMTIHRASELGCLALSGHRIWQTHSTEIQTDPQDRFWAL